MRDTVASSLANDRELTIVEARSRLTRLSDELGQTPETGAITITRHGKPVMALLNFELYEAIVETLEIVGDPALMEALRGSISELESGETIPWEDAKRELKLK